MSEIKYTVKSTRVYSMGQSAGVTDSMNIEVVLADASGLEYHQLYLVRKTGNDLRAGFPRGNTEICFMEGETSVNTRTAGKQIDLNLEALFKADTQLGKQLGAEFGKYFVEHLGFYNGQPHPINRSPEPSKTLYREEPQGHTNEEIKRSAQRRQGRAKKGAGKGR